MSNAKFNEKSKLTKLSIKFDPFYMRAIDIIIPFHDAFDDVIRCFNSIKTVNANRFAVTLVDDCSTDTKFTDQFDKIDGVQIIKHDKHLGFGAAVNTGIKNTNQDIILILHSDTVLQQNSVINLGNNLVNLAKDKVAMITAKTTNPIGGHKDCYGVRPVTKESINTENIILKDSFIPFYCCMTYRSIFQKIGLLEEYPYGYYEDEEFAYRLKKFNYKQAICGNSWVEHVGGQTFKKFINDPTAKKTIEEDNFAKFSKKIARYA